MRSLIGKVLQNFGVLLPGVLMSFGLFFVLFGFCALTEIPSAQSQIRQLEQLQPMSAATPGQAAFIEGVVSNRNRIVHRQFAVYLREEYRSSGRTSQWVKVAHHTPPLLIEANGQTIRVLNNNYALEETDVTVEEAAPTFSQGAVQTRGFVVGSPVLTVGTVTENGKEFVAEFLYAGTRDEFIAHLNQEVHFGLWYGSTFFLIGVLITILLTILERKLLWSFLGDLIIILGVRKLWYFYARRIRKRKLLAQKL